MPQFIILTKGQVYLNSTRSRHPSVNGDCVLRLATPVASISARFKAHGQASWTVAATGGQPRVPPGVRTGHYHIIKMRIKAGTAH